MDNFIVPSKRIRTKKPRVGGIYQWRQISTGKKYIGSTRDFNERKSTHLRYLAAQSHENIHLLNAWKKYGEDDFVFEILEIIEDKSRRLEREQWYFDNVVDWSNDFNMARRAACPPDMTGKKLPPRSEETRQKIREAHLGKKMGPCSPERRANISKANTGKKYRKHTPESNRKKSERQTGKKKKSPTPEQNLANSKRLKALGIRPPSRLGMKATPETRAKLSKVQRARQAALRERRKEKRHESTRDFIQLDLGIGSMGD